MLKVLVGFVTLTCMLLLSAAILWVNDRFRDWRDRDRRSDDERKKDEATFILRLENPRWQEITQSTGGEPSPALRGLYADRNLLHQQNFMVRAGDIEKEVSHFLPADGETLRDEWYQNLPKDAFPFARDIFGDFLFVRMHARGTDGPVEHWYHDGNDIEPIAPSLAEFVEWCRAAVSSGARLQL